LSSTPSSSTPSSSSSSSRSALDRELDRAEELYTGARRQYREAMAEGTPSELRRAADQVEDYGFTEIARSLRRRATEREGTR